MFFILIIFGSPFSFQMAEDLEILQYKWFCLKKKTNQKCFVINDNVIMWYVRIYSR